MSGYCNTPPQKKSKPLQFKRGTARAFRLHNILLLEGQPAIEVDTFKLKIGDGRTRYNMLPYIGENFKSEDGKSAYQIWKDAGYEGTVNDFLEFLTGEPGKSAYEIWRSVGNEGSITDFINSLQGERGDNGKSAYEHWIDEGNRGTVSDFLSSLVGESAYALWRRLGNEGTEEEFLEHLKGESAFETWKKTLGTPESTPDDFFEYIKGKPGKSAFEIWLSRGNKGTEDDFLASLKGERGDNGKSAYQIWLDEGNTGTEEDFLKGLEGDSAYEVWKKLPGNEDKSEEEYVQSLSTTSWGTF